MLSRLSTLFPTQTGFAYLMLCKGMLSMRGQLSDETSRKLDDYYDDKKHHYPASHYIGYLFDCLNYIRMSRFTPLWESTACKLLEIDSLRIKSLSELLGVMYDNDILTQQTLSMACSLPKQDVDKRKAYEFLSLLHKNNCLTQQASLLVHFLHRCDDGVKVFANLLTSPDIDIDKLTSFNHPCNLREDTAKRIAKISSLLLEGDALILTYYDWLVLNKSLLKNIETILSADQDNIAGTMKLLHNNPAYISTIAKLTNDNFLRYINPLTLLPKDKPLKKIDSHDLAPLKYLSDAIAVVHRQKIIFGVERMLHGKMFGADQMHHFDNAWRTISNFRNLKPFREALLAKPQFALIQCYLYSAYTYNKQEITPHNIEQREQMKAKILASKSDHNEIAKGIAILKLTRLLADYEALIFKHSSIASDLAKCLYLLRKGELDTPQNIDDVIRAIYKTIHFPRGLVSIDCTMGSLKWLTQERLNTCILKAEHLDRVAVAFYKITSPLCINADLSSLAIENDRLSKLDYCLKHGQYAPVMVNSVLHMDHNKLTFVKQNQRIGDALIVTNTILNSAIYRGNFNKHAPPKLGDLIGPRHPLRHLQHFLKHRHHIFSGGQFNGGPYQANYFELTDILTVLLQGHRQAKKKHQALQKKEERCEEITQEEELTPQQRVWSDPYLIKDILFPHLSTHIKLPHERYRIWLDFFPKLRKDKTKVTPAKVLAEPGPETNGVSTSSSSTSSTCINDAPVSIPMGLKG